MEVITAYGIDLVPLAQEHLELVRGWRNDPKIAQHMASQDHITASMQQTWFANLDAERSPHFVIRYQGRYVGVCSAKRTKIGATSCETGMYLYHNEPTTLIAFRAALALNDFCFERLQVKQIDIYVLAQNTRALGFNEKLGFVRHTDQPDPSRVDFTLTPEQHERSKAKIIRFFRS